VLKPGLFEAHNNLGTALQLLGRMEEAEASYRRTVALNPGFAQAHNNLGAALAALDRGEEAEACYRRALALKPDLASAHMNLGIARLRLGDFEQGWREYDWRLQTAEFRSSVRSQPLWTGGPLTGKTILLYAEQGMGDTLQFLRYCPLVAAKGARVVLEVQPALARLAAGTAGAGAVLAAGEALPEVDLCCPLLSLPQRLGTGLESIPADIPYLCADSALARRWAREIAPAPGLKVGLVWAGHPDHKNDRNRSVALERLRPLLATKGVSWFSLQVGGRAAEIGGLPPGTIADLSARLEDFAETAAAISHLDLVISVDTAVAHLAGALGRRCWVLLPFLPDWRWLQAREDSPWYPSVRLFRQQRSGDWDTVVARAAEELSRLVKAIPRSEAMPAPSAPSDLRPAAMMADEIGRRKATIAARQSDTARWADPRQLEAAWEPRSQRAADWVPRGATVYDLGCGAMLLGKHLHSSARYVPCDLVRRDERTELCDLNAGKLPRGIETADRVVMLGLLEYVFDLKSLLVELRRLNKTIICSYCCSDYTAHLDRQALGWVNAYSFRQLAELCFAAGYRVQAREKIDALQDLLVLNPVAARQAERRVVVLSYNNAGNFGDRLGYHNICAMLPDHATVEFAHLKPWTATDKPIDLLVLGVGNSLFEPLLTAELQALVDRSKRKIGIFGTQYREAIDRGKLDRLTGSLDHWFARFEEDLLLYGKGRSQATHLGDWLIDNFAMTEPTNESLLRIGSEILRELPLDRTIQKIQSCRHVFSERLHPLLCALTSAETVGYAEQRESGSDLPSGKFASMLIDVFGRSFAENTRWRVNRDAVRTYKRAVAQNKQDVRRAIDRLLS
jgi:tetratricopeptide (TPR) repeat protein